MKDDIKSTQEYITSDTALAAYLLSEGISTIRIEKDNPYRFVFPQPVDNYVLAFRAGTAIGNIKNFFVAYKAVLKSVHGR